eukprot:CAMPEP_0183738050 /NCGR_PEP_ID=MMETSP0737-20130205/53680_1 /TAXON_ID=385413 /ORGANISM="Thalassiosira miniscula, Strain CCMP1093" /LENGTH=657 /DNA_ID=CAMNT_0025972497 /DNA_START=5 /DNA_END=1975 /DNA_ORIENTATION=+
MLPSPSKEASIITRPALYSTTGISFWGGIDPISGIVIDRTHPLHGTCVTDKILVIPSGRGSCTGSQVMLELILNGKGPSAIVTREVDSILCTGAVVAEEFFFGDDDNDDSDNDGSDADVLNGANDDGIDTGINVEDEKKLPIICAVGEQQFTKLVEAGSDSLTMKFLDDIDGNSSKGNIRIQYCGGEEAVQNEIITNNLLKRKDTLDTDSIDATSEEPLSPAAEMAMRTVLRIASISGATELIPITSAHIDAVTYIGPGGLKFARRLVELGGKVKVKTTLNSQSCDRRRWKELGVDPSLASNANSVGDAYVQLGCDEMSFTCAPYLLPSRPRMRENIIWGESNAVVYSNSVLGARTEKYADYFDICAAIVGLVPNVGVHVTENRAPSIVIDATKLIRDHLLPGMNKDIATLSGNSEDFLYEHRGFDSFFPAMGWTCGNLSDGGVPLILGFDSLPAVSGDNLKAFCAAFGTTGSAPLFHMANITPEAIGDDTIQRLLQSCGERRVEVTKADLCKSYETLDSGKGDGDDVSLVALGNPHLSLEELGRLSKMIDNDNRGKHESVRVIATLGRHVHSNGTELGFTQNLESFGVQFINDTCWCMLLDPPIIPPNRNAKILTNSGKYAHYGPGLTNRRIRFGSMHDCMEAAKTGNVRRGNGNG